MIKKIFSLLFILLPLSLQAREVKITRPSLVLDKATNMLTIEFAMNVEEVEVNSTQSYTFAPALRGQGHYSLFSPVVVTGKDNYKFTRKERRLAKKYGYEAPYEIVEGRVNEERKNNIVNYKITIPFEEWIENSKMLIIQDGKECCEIDMQPMKVIEPVVVEEEEPIVLPQAGQLCEPCMSMVSYLVPQEEPLKVRNEQTTLRIQYLSGKTDVDPAYKDNAKEIEALRKTLEPLVAEKELVIFKALSVKGFASPDGRLSTNTRISEQRAQSFAEYVETQYPMIADSIVKVSSVAEDWETFEKMLRKEQPEFAQKALDVIAQNKDLDVREAKLKKALGASYQTLMDSYYPRLRRLLISVDYEVREVRNEDAARLIYTQPKLLNLQEMYEVAKKYEPGTKQYKEVYDIAANNYPTDVVANVNAASAAIVSGDFVGARNYLDRVKSDPRTYNNYGVLEWLAGNFDEAKKWFEKALQTEPKAYDNLKKMQEYDKE